MQVLVHQLVADAQGNHWIAAQFPSGSNVLFRQPGTTNHLQRFKQSEMIALLAVCPKHPEPQAFIPFVMFDHNTKEDYIICPECRHQFWIVRTVWRSQWQDDLQIANIG